MLKHEDVCTLLKNPDDRDILTRQLFDVNMRLFDTSREYRRVVQAAAMYIRECAVTTREGYKKPHGFSGANAGIPLNIIALADGTIIINPKIVQHHGERIGESNCGSLLLEEPIRVKRFAWVRVTGYNLDGYRLVMEGYLPTVQHEIDHNMGILITDRQVEENGDGGK